jgi:hypothetical protein
MTRIFLENGLSVTRADVSTQDEKAVNTFYVTDVNGRPVDLKTVEAIRKENPLLGVHAVPAAYEDLRAHSARSWLEGVKPTPKGCSISYLCLPKMKQKAANHISICRRRLFRVGRSEEYYLLSFYLAISAVIVSKISTDI